MTEIMLTLEASIDNLDLEFRPIDFMRELFMSTPNLAKDIGDHRRSAITAPRQAYPHHARSTSYTVSAYRQSAYVGPGEIWDWVSFYFQNGHNLIHTILLFLLICMVSIHRALDWKNVGYVLLLMN